MVLPTNALSGRPCSEQTKVTLVGGGERAGGKNGKIGEGRAGCMLRDNLLN